MHLKIIKNCLELKIESILMKKLLKKTKKLIKYNFNIIYYSDIKNIISDFFIYIYFLIIILYSNQNQKI